MSMPEIYEEEKSEGLNLQRYLDIARRRYLYFLIPLLVGWLSIWSVTWILKPIYKSSTTLLVEGSSMPANYVLPNVSDNLQGRMQSITQQILSRTRLLMIMDRLGLYRGEKGYDKLTPEEKVDHMRKDIDIQLVREANGQAITAFKIDYSAHDPHVAQEVTRELADLFIRENLQVRQKESQNTTNFLQTQLEAARSDLEQQEAKMRAFEAGHEGTLPTQQSVNLQILGGLQSQLANEQDALNNANQQRAYYQALIQEYKSSSSGAPTVDGMPSGLAGYDVQLANLQEQLADLRSRYTDDYPDVQRVKLQIARTEKLRQDAARALKNHPPVTESIPLPPQHDAALSQLEGQLQANQVEIANRERSIAALKQRIDDYQSRLS